MRASAAISGNNCAGTLLLVYPLLHRSDSPNVSGVKRGLVQLLRETPPTWRPEIALPVASAHDRDFSPAPLHYLGIDDTLAWHRFRSRGAKVGYPGILLRSSWKLRRIAAARRPAAVVSEMSSYLGAGLAARSLGIPSIFHVHEHPFDRGRRGIALYLHMMRLCADAIITVAPFNREFFLRHGWPAERIRVASPGIDTEHWAPDAAARAEFRARHRIADSTIVVLTVGRFDVRKGMDLIVEAARRTASGSPLRFVVIGGPAEPHQFEFYHKVQRECEETELGKRLILCGAVDDEELRRAFCASDIFAVTAPFDMFPTASLEAMATGVPVINLSEGGVRDQVVHGETGLQVLKRDSEVLEQALLHLVENPAVRMRMGVAARRRVLANFDRRKAASGFWQAVSELMLASV